MGVVFRARDDKLERDVALKMIHPRWLSLPHLRDRLVAEARATARVTHSHVVQVYSFGEHEGVPYFTMEHVPGRSLEDLVEQGWLTSSSLEERLRILEAVCEGLEAIHAANLVHGDIKPSNVLLGEDGRVALVDMGLARLLDGPDVQLPGLWGTPAYVAPELAEGNPVPVGLLPLADLYSTGVLAFELLTGRLPFMCDDTREMLRIRVSQNPPRASRVRSSLSPVFDLPLARALHRDPMKRPQSARELFASFREVAPHAQRPKRRLRFLVADDDHDHCLVVSRILARAFPGSTIETCSDGESALHAARHHRPSLAVVDLNMPGMNGVELTAALRENEERRTPIVVLTGEGSGRDWRLLMQLGADRFMVKPMATDSFINTVRSLVDG